MQVVASNPKYLNKTDVPEDVLEAEKKIIKDGLLSNEETKNKKLDIEKVTKAKINSWYEDNVLNEQQFVIVDHEDTDSKAKVSNVVSKKGKELNIDDLKLKDFKLFN